MTRRSPDKPIVFRTWKDLSEMFLVLFGREGFTLQAEMFPGKLADGPVKSQIRHKELGLIRWDMFVESLHKPPTFSQIVTPG